MVNAVTRPWNLPDVAEAVPLRHVAVPIRQAVEPLPAPSFTEGDIAAAREQGLREGSRLAEQATAARVARALENLTGLLQAGRQAAAELAQQTATAVAGVVLQGLAAAFPVLESRLGPRETSLLMRAVLPGLLREPAVSVRVGPAGAAALHAELGRLPEAERARVTVEPDATLGDADIRISWRDGEARRDGAAIRQAVLQALAALVDENASERDDP